MTFPWQEFAPDALVRALDDPELVLTPALARDAWQRAASFRHSDPSVGHRISAALVAAATRAAGPGDSSAEIQAVAWCSLAESSNATGRVRDAIDAFERASSFAADAGDEQLLGQILVGRVHVLALAGRGDESSKLASRAEALLKRRGDLALLAKLYMNRGNALYQQDRYRDAYETYARADRSFEAAGVRDATRVGLLMNQAVVATNLERFDEARVLFERAESLSSSLGVPHLEAFARFNHAFLERTRGDYRSALRLLEEAEQTFAAQKSRDMVAASDRARAEIYLELGMPGRGLELVRSAAETFASEAMELDARLARADEARALLALGEAGTAIPILEANATWFHEQKNRAREAFTRADIAVARAGAGEFAAAVSPAREAVRELERLGLVHAAAIARAFLARTLVAMGRKAEAELSLAPALARERSLATRPRLELWCAAGMVSAAAGARGDARRRYRRAAELLERERHFIPGIELRSRAFERFGGVYRELARLELSSPRPRLEALLPLAEAARARSFADRLSVPRGSRAAAGSRELQRKRELLGALTRKLDEAEMPESGAPDAGKAEALRRRVVQLENEIVADLRRAEEHEAAPGAGRRARRPGLATRLEALLASDDVLLEYLMIGDRVLALALGKGRRDVRVLPAPLAEIRAAEERVRFQLESMILVAGRGNGNLAFARRSTDDALRALHDVMLRPVLEHFTGGGRLIVVPDGFLHRVPFQCLHDGTSYLNERWVVSRLPTAELLFRRARRRPGSRGGVVISGTVSGGPALVARELDEVSAHFPPGETRVLRDAPAADILAALDQARVAHLSSHGYFRDDNPVFSRLSTADGAVFVADLLERRLRSELVVLSACQSGRVFTGGGDDLSGVAHAFLAAGARRLVASLWRVHDEATHDLMKAFYRAYVDGRCRDPARALRDAERATRTRWDHPFYWGSFSVHGA